MADINPPPNLHRLSRDQSLLKPLLMGLASLLLALAFMHLGSEIVEGDTLSVDQHVLRVAQQLRIGHPWIASLMRDLSGLGSTIVLTLITVTTVGYLALVSVRRTALLVAVSVATGSVLVSAFKFAFGRLRPDPIFSDHWVSGLSFPSGHASMSAIVFLTIGVLVASTRERFSERAYILAASTAVTLLVGASRIVLGVHWTSDVLGGWTFGTAWAMAWLILARRTTT
ncbi:MAG: phosphatase PAP2 family protein [Rhizobacter sp.]|nr:phosphatase PAP2 family protein [Rhizobacter sp.]